MTDALRPTARIRLSRQARDQLITLKRRTGIRHWNALCRWALCRSLAEPSVPPSADIPADSNIEMTWDVFGGTQADIYAILLRYRCLTDDLGTEPATLNTQFRLHLHRGIAYLAADRDIRTVGALVDVALRAPDASNPIPDNPL